MSPKPTAAMLEKLTYAGFSYGTELGTAYAEAFPQRVRALVLDGAIDPTQSPIDSSVKQAAGFQLAFDNFARDCTSKPNCPLGTDPAQATARFQAIMRPLIDRPVPIGDGRTLGFDDALTGVTQALGWLSVSGGTTVVTVEYSTDGSAADADFTPVTIAAGANAPFNLLGRYCRAKIVQTVADATKTKLYLQAKA